jgi:hypothetical protein
MLGLENILQRKVTRMNGPDVGFERSQRLNVAVASSNGKRTTAELVERLLFRNHGRSASPRQFCSFKEQTNDLDYLFPRIELLPPELNDVLQPAARITKHKAHICEGALKLKVAETAQSHFKATPKPPSNQRFQPLQDQSDAAIACFFRAAGIMGVAALRPSVAVPRSLAFRGLERYGSAGAYVRASGGLCPNQRALHWGIVQGEALARLREPSLPALATVISCRRRPAAVAVFQARGPRARGWRSDSCRMGFFYSLHHRGFVARSRGRSGEKCDFRRRSFACTGLFELGSVSRPSKPR